MNYDNPVVAKEQTPAKESMLAKSLQPSIDYFGNKAKPIFQELGQKYDVKNLMNQDSGTYPLQITDKTKEIITDPVDQARYEEFAEIFNTYTTIRETLRNPDASHAAEINFLDAKAEPLFQELKQKYNMQKVIDWQSQRYPLQVTDKIKEVITEPSDLAKYEKFAHLLNAMHALKPEKPREKTNGQITMEHHLTDEDRQLPANEQAERLLGKHVNPIYAVREGLIDISIPELADIMLDKGAYQEMHQSVTLGHFDDLDTQKRIDMVVALINTREAIIVNDPLMRKIKEWKIADPNVYTGDPVFAALINNGYGEKAARLQGALLNPKIEEKPGAQLRRLLDRKPQNLP